MRRTSPLRLLAIALLLSALGIPAASAAVKDRITAAVSGSSRVTIPNSVHGKVRLATDLGPAAADTRLVGMTLRFSLTDAQQAALNQLLLDQQNPASPRYHQWLTPGQYAAQFGLSPADIAKVAAWLTSQGFTITEVANSGTFIRFDGTAAQAQTAFATSIHSLSLNGETHFANVTDATVPSAFSGVVQGITGLHNFRLKPRLRTSVVKAPVNTEFTSSISGDHYIAPGDFYTIYDLNPLLNAGTNGSGVPVAVMGQVDLNLPDVSAFRIASGLSANLPSVKTYGTDPGPPVCDSCTTGASDSDLEESSLDVEWSGAVAPSASIIFVNSTDVIDISLTDAIDNDLAPIISISYGGCESSWGASELAVLNTLFQQANAQGITVIGPAGDAGATDCDYSDVSATQGLAVDFPASSPYVTGMGGTMFNEGTALGATPYWNSSTTSDIVSSAISYIPEAVWNEDAVGQEFFAGGGGASVVFPKPVWQVGAGVPADGARDVPDLALNAAANHDPYLYCVLNSCTNGGFRAYDGESLNVAGGTSFAAPSFAGILALVEQTIGSRVGNANPTIYSLANSSYYNNIFHDITVGNNDSLCTIGTKNCPNGGSIGFNAGVGYDQATGWGSVDAAVLVSHWAAVTPPVALQNSTADFTLTPATTTISVASASQSGTASFTVAPVNGFTGLVSFAATSASSTGVTPTFSFSPTSVTSSGTTTLTISFPTASLRVPAIGPGPGTSLALQSHRHIPWYAEGSGATLSCLLLLVLPRRRRLGGLLIALASVAIVFGASGCSSGNSAITSPPTSNTTSAAGTYTIVITGTHTDPIGSPSCMISNLAGSTCTVSHAVALNLTVQ